MIVYLDICYLVSVVIATIVFWFHRFRYLHLNPWVLILMVVDCLCWPMVLFGELVDKLLSKIKTLDH